MVTKRSVSLADDVAVAVEEAAKQDGVSFSAWLSKAAEKQLQVRQGLRGVAAWEGETGSLRGEGLVYGVGALHAAARGDRMMWALHRAALSNGIVPVIPAVAVAEAYRTEARGDRIAELLDGTEVEPFSSEAARRSGELAARCDTSELATIGVIEMAERRTCAVV